MRNLFLASAVLALLGTAPAYAGDDAGAKRLWASKCSNCHGDDGKAQTDQGKKLGIHDMTTKDWQAAHPADKIAAALKPGYKVKAAGAEQDHVTSEIPQAKVDGLVAIIKGLAK